MGLYLKKERSIVTLYVVLIVAATLLLYRGTVHWDQVAPLFMGLLLPSLVGHDGKTRQRAESAPQRVGASGEEPEEPKSDEPSNSSGSS